MASLKQYDAVGDDDGGDAEASVERKCALDELRHIVSEAAGISLEEGVLCVKSWPVSGLSQDDASSLMDFSRKFPLGVRLVYPAGAPAVAVEDVTKVLEQHGLDREAAVKASAAIFSILPRP